MATRRTALVAAALLLCAVFLALGGWQVERRAWKHELIARVDARVHAEPVAPPGPERWPAVNAADDEYRRVQLHGRWLPGPATRVQAVTTQGAGWWVLAPLRLDDGSVVMVNRGFVPPDWKEPATTTGAEAAPGPAAAPTATVTGLLRLSEPGGGFLRHNDPAADRWFSRDVPAIATARGLPAATTAPYFIDADAAPGATQAGPDAAPMGGLTVVAFHDSHLVYALTWFGLALLSAWAAWRVGREGQNRRPAHARSAHALPAQPHG